jgi:cytidine deaminase
MSLKIESANMDVKELFKYALLARENSHSPYSGCKVGASIRIANGRIFSGCNIENSSYGATVCAERVAIQKAVSELGEIQVTDVMVVVQAPEAWPPCGMCRQVIAEFGPQARIYMSNIEGNYQTLPFNDLFPQAFTPDFLKK